MISPARFASAERPAPDSTAVVALRSLALALATGCLLVDLTLPAGLFGAVLGAVAASALGALAARSRLRLATVWAAAALASGVGIAASSWLVSGSAGPALFGLRGALSVADAVEFGLLAFAVTAAVRITAARVESFEVVELSAVAISLASVTAAHRDGAINHPRWLSDWAWTNGHDPRRILLYCGAATVVALVAALLRERRGRGPRVLLHLGAASAIAALLLLLFRLFGTPTPPRGEGLGLDGKGGDKRSGGSGGGRAGGHGGGNQLQQLEFKDDYSSSSQDSPVGVVILHDDYSPPLGYYYFRQTAFSQYNGHRLVARTRDDIDTDILTDFPVARTKVPDAPPYGERGENKDRVAVRSTVALLVDHVHPFGLESPVEFAPKVSPDLSRFLRVYDVTSAALAMRYEDLLGKRSSRWNAEAAKAYTELPEDPRYRRLADQIVDENLRQEYRNDPFAQAIAISSWLGKHSIYSMKSKHAGADDPTADFLFGDQIGYCVHFAHAAAFLLRARGLPSRIAAGYVADEGRRGAGSTILLRQKDAHAWAELYLDGFGWIIVDVAPERSLDPPDTPPDQDLQRLLGELARGDPHGGKLGPPKRATEWPSLREVAARTLRVLLEIVALLYLVKLWRIAAPWLAGSRGVHRVAYRAALDRLAEAGHRRREGETRERFAERLTARTPTLGPLTVAHVGRAFGSRRLPPPAETRAMASAVRREAWRRAPWWRILFGALNPASWLLSR